jgi:NTE family protein
VTLKPLSLALQGGGAHGAFAWGVLDALLEDGRFDFRAASGASAGAMNAAVMTSGLAKGGAPEARRSLDRFWSAISDAGSPFGDLGFWTRSLGEGMKDGLASASSLMSLNPFLSLAQTMAGGMAEGFASTPAGGLSPYQFNPFNFNPLKEALSRNTDFAAVRSFEPLSLFIAATEVRTGRLKVFGRPELSVDHILASACLPYLFQAVEIGGEPYWDGGFTANPPLWPLYYGDLPRDVLVVSLNPFCRGGPAPTDMASIIDRLNEITFNATLMAEFRASAFVNRLCEEDLLNQKGKALYQPVRLHLISADGRLDDLPLSSKFTTDFGFLSELKARGRKAAAEWLKSSFDAVGRASSVDVRREFL